MTDILALDVATRAGWDSILFLMISIDAIDVVMQCLNFAGRDVGRGEFIEGGAQHTQVLFDHSYLAIEQRKAVELRAHGRKLHFDCAKPCFDRRQLGPQDRPEIIIISHSKSSASGRIRNLCGSAVTGKATISQ
jgi:hypothetical protein